MGLEESRILANNVHNVTGDNGLVVLATLHLSKSKKVLDDRDQESLLCLLIHGQ